MPTLKSDTDLVGILVGEIMRDAKPLIFYLYDDGGGKHHTRVSESPFKGDKAAALAVIAQSFESVIVDIWTNFSYPCWHFVQMKRGQGPARLMDFGLPWSVYFGWRKRLLGE